jgi:hypothetical protein
VRFRPIQGGWFRDKRFSRPLIGKFPRRVTRLVLIASPRRLIWSRKLDSSMSLEDVFERRVICKSSTTSECANFKRLL